MVELIPPGAPTTCLSCLHFLHGQQGSWEGCPAPRGKLWVTPGQAQTSPEHPEEPGWPTWRDAMGVGTVLPSPNPSSAHQNNIYPLTFTWLLHRRDHCCPSPPSDSCDAPQQGLHRFNQRDEPYPALQTPSQGELGVNKFFPPNSSISTQSYSRFHLAPIELGNSGTVANHCTAPALVGSVGHPDLLK